MGYVEDMDRKIQKDTGIGLFGSDYLDDVSGASEEEAAKEAAAAQEAAGEAAEAELRTAQERLEAELSPYREFGVEQGVSQLPGLFEQQQAAISDPSAVINNPFFQAMSRDQEQRLINQRAALGKGGSGGTGDALTRNMLLLGNQFSQQNLGNIQQQIQNRFNAAQIGQSSAAQTGVSGLQTAGNIGGIMGNVANAQAAGIMGAQQAGAAGTQNMIGLLAAPFTGGASLGMGGMFGGGGLGGGSGVASPPPSNNPYFVGPQMPGGGQGQSPYFVGPTAPRY